MGSTFRLRDHISRQRKLYCGRVRVSIKVFRNQGFIHLRPTSIRCLGSCSQMSNSQKSYISLICVRRNCGSPTFRGAQDRGSAHRRGPKVARIENCRMAQGTRCTPNSFFVLFKWNFWFTGMTMSCIAHRPDCCTSTY